MIFFFAVVNFFYQIKDYNSSCQKILRQVPCVDHFFSNLHLYLQWGFKKFVMNSVSLIYNTKLL
jgi:hypothetical protein